MSQLDFFSDEPLEHPDRPTYSFQPYLREIPKRRPPRWQADRDDDIERDGLVPLPEAEPAQRDLLS